MTTGRINQVCQLLPSWTHSNTSDFTHVSAELDSTSAIVHISLVPIGENTWQPNQATPSKRNSQLDTSSYTLTPSIREDAQAEATSLNTMWITLRLAKKFSHLYPKSFNDHKETLLQQFNTEPLPCTRALTKTCLSSLSRPKQFQFQLLIRKNFENFPPIYIPQNSR